MNNTEVMAQIMFAFTQLPEDVRKDSTEAFKYVIRSFDAWQKVKEELKEEMTGLDMFIEKEHTIRWCLHVIDEALGEVGEQDGYRRNDA